MTEKEQEAVWKAAENELKDWKIKVEQHSNAVSMFNQSLQASSSSNWTINTGGTIQPNPNWIYNPQPTWFTPHQSSFNYDTLTFTKALNKLNMVFTPSGDGTFFPCKLKD